MSRKKYLLAGIVITVVIYGLPVGTNIPISSASGISLIGGIGVHSFNLSQGGTLRSEGYVILSNTGNNSISLSLSVVNSLSPVDLGPDGKPRMHKVSDHIVFYPLPDVSWVKIENSSVTIEPRSECKVRYIVEASCKDVYEAIHGNTSNGFLGYINVKPDAEHGAGVHIGVNYNYKMFLMFEGVYHESNGLFIPLVASIIIVAGVVVFTVFLSSKKFVPVKIENDGNDGVK